VLKFLNLGYEKTMCIYVTTKSVEWVNNKLEPVRGSSACRSHVASLVTVLMPAVIRTNTPCEFVTLTVS